MEWRFLTHARSIRAIPIARLFLAASDDSAQGVRAWHGIRLEEFLTTFAVRIRFACEGAMSYFRRHSAAKPN